MVFLTKSQIGGGISDQTRLSLVTRPKTTTATLTGLSEGIGRAGRPGSGRRDKATTGRNTAVEARGRRETRGTAAAPACAVSVTSSPVNTHPGPDSKASVSSSSPASGRTVRGPTGSTTTWSTDPTSSTTTWSFDPASSTSSRESEGPPTSRRGVSLTRPAIVNSSNVLTISNRNNSIHIGSDTDRARTKTDDGPILSMTTASVAKSSRAWSASRTGC